MENMVDVDVATEATTERPLVLSLFIDPSLRDQPQDSASGQIANRVAAVGCDSTCYNQCDTCWTQCDCLSCHK